jgi:tRNA (cmo5U34)-methyltransferase
MKKSKTNFNDTQWTNNGFAHEYLRDSDIYIPQREHVLQLIKLIFSFYINTEIKNPHVIDLGCGDGAITKILIDVNKNLLSTLIDGSEHMLESARKNIPNINIKETIHISSLAIHHLNEIEKDRLFKYIYAKLKPGALFINYDPVLSPSLELEQLNLIIWKEWILNYEAKISPRRDKSLEYIPSQYKSNEDNVPSTLDSQLEMMKNAGFLGVNLFYKYGLFCLFGGRK